MAGYDTFALTPLVQKWGVPGVYVWCCRCAPGSLSYASGKCAGVILIGTAKPTSMISQFLWQAQMACS